MPLLTEITGILVLLLFNNLRKNSVLKVRGGFLQGITPENIFEKDTIQKQKNCRDPSAPWICSTGWARNGYYFSRDYSGGKTFQISAHPMSLMLFYDSLRKFKTLHS